MMVALNSMNNMYKLRRNPMAMSQLKKLQCRRYQLRKYKLKKHLLRRYSQQMRHLFRRHL